MARAANRHVDLAILGAWHAEAFARTKVLKKLSAYMQRQETPQSNAAQALAFFHSLKARGVPVTITRH